MKITFIGTGSGKASLKRFHSSFLISENYNLLVDCGDGNSKALLNAEIDYTKIDGIIFSHFHPDHYTGLPALIVQMKMAKRKNKLDIFVHQSLQNYLKSFLDNSYILEDRMKFNLNYVTFNFDEEITVDDKLNFIARKNSHLSVDIETEKYPGISNASSSFLFNDGLTRLHYTADIGTENDLHLFEDKKPEYIISEITHIELAKILSLKDELHLKKLILTHISDEDEERLKEIRIKYDPKVIIAEDKMQIQLL